MNKYYLFLFFILSCVVLVVDAEAASLICNDDTDHECLNGGSCIEGVANKTGQIIQVCDCQDATDGNKYVGLNCESLAPEFCINGGKPRTIQSGIVICLCPEDYTGLYCELSKNSNQIKALISPDDKDDDECTLKCMNGGVCAFGRRDPLPAELALHPNFDPNQVDDEFFYQYCQCPALFYGKQCESSYDVCSGSTNNEQEHYCHNNASCVHTIRDDEPMNNMCNCSAAHRPGNHFTGRYCEYRNLVTCSDHKFCTNGGTCTQKDNTTDAWSCDCPEGYDGGHCENISSMGAPKEENAEKTTPTPTQVKNQNDKNDGATATPTSSPTKVKNQKNKNDEKGAKVEMNSKQNTTNSSNTKHIFWLVLLALLTTLLLVSIAIRRNNRRVRKKKNSPSSARFMVKGTKFGNKKKKGNKKSAAPEEFPVSSFNGVMSFNSRRFKTPNTIGTMGSTNASNAGNNGRSGSNGRSTPRTRMLDMMTEDLQDTVIT